MDAGSPISPRARAATMRTSGSRSCSSRCSSSARGACAPSSPSSSAERARPTAPATVQPRDQPVDGAATLQQLDQRRAGTAAQLAHHRHDHRLEGTPDPVVQGEQPLDVHRVLALVGDQGDQQRAVGVGEGDAAAHRALRAARDAARSPRRARRRARRSPVRRQRRPPPRSRRAASQHRLHPAQQLAGAERFDHVVVSAHARSRTRRPPPAPWRSAG